MHPKDKGDIGKLAVMTDLIEKGYSVFDEFGERGMVDIIALDNKGNVKKIQIKARTVYQGSVSVHFESTRSNTKKITHTPYDADIIDIIAIYDIDNKKIAYVSSDVFKKQKCFALRVEKTKNNQTKGVKMFDDYKDLI